VLVQPAKIQQSGDKVLKFGALKEPLRLRHVIRCAIEPKQQENAGVQLCNGVAQ